MTPLRALTVEMVGAGHLITSGFRDYVSSTAAAADCCQKCEHVHKFSAVLETGLGVCLTISVNALSVFCFGSLGVYI